MYSQFAYWSSLFQTLRILNLGSNRFTALGVQHLCNALKSNTVFDLHTFHSMQFRSFQTLTKLTLSYNDVGDQGSQYLRDALRENTVENSCSSNSSLHRSHIDTHQSRPSTYSNQSSRNSLLTRCITTKYRMEKTKPILPSLIIPSDLDTCPTKSSWEFYRRTWHAISPWLKTQEEEIENLLRIKFLVFISN